MPRFVADCLKWIATFAVMVSAALAQDAPRRVQQVTFSPPKEVSIRQKTGPSRTFSLISLTEEVATIRTSAGKDVEIEMSRIKSIRTRDGDFDFSPEDEAFASLVRRAGRITGVTVETVEVLDPIERFAPGEEIPDDPVPQPRNSDPSPAIVRNDDTNPGPADPDRPRPVIVATPESTTDVQPEMTPEDAGDSPAPGTTILTCATCGRELPAGVRDGDKCPHCGIVFWSRAPVPASGTPGTNNTGYPEASGYPTASGTPDAAAAPATAPPSNVTTSSGGLNLETVPMWMKVGFFVGLIAIGWLLLQRR